MKKSLYILIFVFIFYPTFGQNIQLISEYEVDTSQFYSNFSEISSFNGYSRYASGYIGDIGEKMFGVTIIHNEFNYIVIFQSLQHPNFKVLDILKIEKKSGHNLQNMTCLTTGDVDTEIIALAKIEKIEFQTKEYFEIIVKAWRLNMKKKIIETIEHSGVKCFNEGYGV